MKFKLFFVDTFTAIPFKGNPSSICYVDSFPPDATMQAIGAELSLPVTAFICKMPGRPGHFSIRYFTTITEIPACGHGTLGSATIALLHDRLDKVTFHTIEHREIQASAAGGKVVMSYPRFPWRPADPEKEILQSLGIGSFLEAAFCRELDTLFIEIESAAQLRDIQPDFARMIKSSEVVQEVVVTTAADLPGYDYMLRSFCPWMGIDEDPVTGSVHSVLGARWQQKLGKSDMKAFQASRRGGEVMIHAAPETIEIGGNSVIIMQGEMSY